jgi:Flp pilus assembly protein CpaB
MLRASRVVVICAVLLLAACAGDDPGAGALRVLPTEFLLPSLTPTPGLTEPLPAAPTATPTAEPVVTNTPMPTPPPLVELVIAVQPIPAGAPIPPEALALYFFPEDYAPSRALNDPEPVIGQVALVEIACFEPVLSHLIAPRTIGSGYDPLPGNCGPLPNEEPPVEFGHVVIAAETIPSGALITPAMVALRRWPQTISPPGSYDTLASVIGSVAQTDILREQPLLAGRVARQN